MASRSVLPLVGAGLCLFGGVFVVIGIVTWRASADLVARGRVADGVVTALEEERSSSRRDRRDGWVYYPRVRFVDAAGQTHEVRSSTGANPPAYDVGEAVRVRYLPERPTDSRIDTWADLWLMPVGFTGMGSLTVLTGLIVLAVHLRRRVH